MRPRFEEPVDTIQDLVDRNLSIVFPWDNMYAVDRYRRALHEVNKTEYIKAAEDLFYTADNWDITFELYKNDIFGPDRKYALLREELRFVEVFYSGRVFMNRRRLNWYKIGELYRSKYPVEGFNPYTGFLTSKKFQFNEV